MFTDLEPEFAVRNTVECTTFLFEGKRYTISTCQLSNSESSYFVSFMTALGDNLNDNEDLTSKDYETMLFIDGESNGDEVYPFGDMPGNEMQGVFCRYDTEDESRVGHQQFVEKVKQVLSDREV